MNFGCAIEALKHKMKVTRKGWNGKGMHVETVDFIYSSGIKVDNIGLVIRTPEGKYNNWVPSITDLFAEDWEVVDEAKVTVNEVMRKMTEAFLRKSYL